MRDLSSGQFALLYQGAHNGDTYSQLRADFFHG